MSLLKQLSQSYEGSLNLGEADCPIDCNEAFGFEVPWKVHGFAAAGEYVPPIDDNYHFNPDVTKAILAGFSFNRRVLVTGYHGTGKSTHIEQIAARLKWPSLRINLDSHISRIDLLGKDAIILREGKQVTDYKQGLLPWALQNPIALAFDEYDAGRPDVMFVIQRVLESEGRMTLLEQNTVLRAHKSFRLFATANTVGLGDTTGLYQGTQQINQAQMDRWNIVTTLNYLTPEQEAAIILSHAPSFDTAEGKDDIKNMVTMANLTRKGFIAGDLSTLMSPRSVISWAQNTEIFKDRELAFRLSFLNKCDIFEYPTLIEYYQRCFGVELDITPLTNS